MLIDSLGRPWSFMIVGEKTKALRVQCLTAYEDTSQDVLGVTASEPLTGVVGRVSVNAPPSGKDQEEQEVSHENDVRRTAFGESRSPGVPPRARAPGGSGGT